MSAVIAKSRAMLLRNSRCSLNANTRQSSSSATALVSTSDQDQLAPDRQVEERAHHRALHGGLFHGVPPHSVASFCSCALIFTPARSRSADVDLEVNLVAIEHEGDRAAGLGESVGFADGEHRRGAHWPAASLRWNRPRRTGTARAPYLAGSLVASFFTAIARPLTLRSLTMACNSASTGASQITPIAIGLSAAAKGRRRPLGELGEVVEERRFDLVFLETPGSADTAADICRISRASAQRSTRAALARARRFATMASETPCQPPENAAPDVDGGRVRRDRGLLLVIGPGSGR